MIVNVYPSEYDGLPIEEHVSSCDSFDDWILLNVPAFDAESPLKFRACLNGGAFPQEVWGRKLSQDSVVDVYPTARDGGTALLVAAVVASVASTIIFKPKLPNVNAMAKGQNQGRSLLEVDAEGNRARLGDIVPERAGRMKCYPDILTSPVRRFIDRRNQELRLFVCLGVGEFDVEPMKISSTPLQDLPNADITYYAPGQDVSGELAAQNWYNAPEVGAATGSAGLKLRGVTTQNSEFDGLASLSGNLMYLPPPEIPYAWQGDIRLVILASQSVQFGQNQTSVFGDFRHLSAGILVTIQGSPNAGIYRVASVNEQGMLLDDRYTDERITNFTPGTFDCRVDRTNALYGVVSRDEDARSVTFQRYVDADTEDSSWTGFPSLSGTAVNVRPSEQTPGWLWTGNFRGCPEGEVTRYVEYDIFCPQGLGKVDESTGEINYVERQIELQWRPENSSQWNSVTQTIGGATKDQLGFTFAVDLGFETAPIFRQRRTTTEDTSTTAMDVIEWYGLRCRLPQNDSYEGLTTAAIRIGGSDLIASQTENQLNVVVTRRLPVLENGEWTEDNRATRSIASWFRHVANSVGYPDAEINQEETARLDATWNARGDYFDHNITEPMTGKDAMNQALAAGSAELANEMTLRPVRDEPRSAFDHMYTPQNMASKLSIDVELPQDEDVDGVEVEYLDPDSWTWQTVDCTLPGDQKRRMEQLVAVGVNDRTRAWRLGMRRRRELFYQRIRYSFSTELDGNNSEYLSYAMLSDDLPNYSKSAIIRRVERNGAEVTLRITEPLEWEEFIIAWRMPDGKANGPWTARRGADDHEVVVELSVQNTPVVDWNKELPHIWIGQFERNAHAALIESVDPQGMKSVNLKGKNYDARVYDSDDEFPEN